MAHRIAEELPEVPPLRVLQRGLAMVPDYRALKDTGTRRHHGLRFEAEHGPTFVDERDGKTKRHGGFRRLADKVVTIAGDDPFYAEYVRHLRDGDFWAADQATADAAGVAFEPEFGGEHPETTKGEEASKVLAERKAKQAKMLEGARKVEEALAKVASAPKATESASAPASK